MGKCIFDPNILDCPVCNDVEAHARAEKIEIEYKKRITERMVVKREWKVSASTFNPRPFNTPRIVEAKVKVKKVEQRKGYTVVDNRRITQEVILKDVSFSYLLNRPAALSNTSTQYEKDLNIVEHVSIQLEQKRSL